MKKLLVFILMLFGSSVYAHDLPEIPYKQIKEKARIFYDESIDKWIPNVNKSESSYYVKTKLNDNETYYLTKDGNNAFQTGCDFEFIKDGKFICYSNNDLKFYDVVYINGSIEKQVLSLEEVQNLLPNYKVVNITAFSPHTNSIKLKKGINNKKILILNDTDRTFEDYTFSSGNAYFETYSLKGFINVTKKGMIQFSKLLEKSDEYPWYVLLIR